MDQDKILEENALQEEEDMLKEIASSITAYGKKRGNLIPILRTIQEKHAYLPAGAIKMAAGHLGIPSSQVYGVATFYNQFRFHPPGRHPIKVCLGTACHVRGGDIILENYERKLGIGEGETTPDREFSVERVACVGCCALAPVAAGAVPAARTNRSRGAGRDPGERIVDLGGILGSILGGLRQQPRDESVELLGQLDAAVAERVGILAHVGHQHCLGGGRTAGEGRGAGQQGECRTAERVQVGARVDLLTADLLRRHELHGAGAHPVRARGVGHDEEARGPG